jgi:hypothetical protein
MSVWAAGTPEAVVEAAYAAFHGRDGHALAALATPESLQAYRDLVHQEIHPRSHEWTIAVLQANEPDIPREAAEWEIERSRRSRADTASRLLQDFAGLGTPAALERATAPQLLDAALKGAPEGMRIVDGCEVLGHVEEPPDTAWVLFRGRDSAGRQMETDDRSPWSSRCARPREHVLPGTGGPRLTTLP